MQIHDAHMYIHILIKYREINSFMMKSSIFNIQNKGFNDRVVSLVQ